MFNIDIETCRACGAAVRVIVCIEDPVVIDKILTHVQEKEAADFADPPMHAGHCRISLTSRRRC